MITREEAIALFEKQLTAAQVVLDSGFGSNPGENSFLYRRRKEMAEIALTALRPVSRERVEQVWRGCPECKPRCGLCIHMGAWDKYGKPYVCERCVDLSNFESDQKFCEVCGAPMTDEAVQMVMERLEELSNGKG